MCALVATFMFCCALCIEKLHTRVEPREIRGDTNIKVPRIEIEHETAPAKMLVLSMLCIFFAARMFAAFIVHGCQQSPKIKKSREILKFKNSPPGCLT